MTVKPHISFVAVGRNDNYGVDFLARAQVFVQNLVTLAEKYSLPSELVLVDWNPPEDRPRLAEALDWPQFRPKHMEIRVPEVPREVHNSLPRSDKFPLFEYLGKNVGARRARGEFILVTNPDVLFSDGLMRLLARGPLERDRYYRTARYDVRPPVPAGSVEEQLIYCRENIIRQSGYVYSPQWTLAARLNPYRRARALAGYAKWQISNRSWINPYCNASGDFFLMHRDHWSTLRGYPEFKSHGHMDSYLTYCAHFNGYRLQILHGRNVYLFHQDHSRSEHAVRPMTDVEEYHRRCKQMVETRRAIIFNDPDWGLAGQALPETQVGECFLRQSKCSGPAPEQESSLDSGQAETKCRTS